MAFSDRIFHELHGFSAGDFGAFTDPFRYVPHPAVTAAAGQVTAYIGSSDGLSAMFSEGKMLGVLVVEEMQSGRVGFLAAFSGNVGGKSIHEGFVPPIFDLTAPDGEFRRREAEISGINRRIASMESSAEYLSKKEKLEELRSSAGREIAVLKERMAHNKALRDEARGRGEDAALVAESQREKADLHRLKRSYAGRLSQAEAELKEYESGILRLKASRASMSEALQGWIFSRYRVHNALGESSDIRRIFEERELVPPGGTGECAAPKLLEHAFGHGFRPLAMGEFWYGASPETAVRNHGDFYPSCTSKCGPLLGYMLRGLDVAEEENTARELKILYEDEAVVAVDKPSGMPSVPGLDGRKSAQEILGDCFSPDGIFAVHRLDMDTSGLLLFARTEEAAAALRSQFEDRAVMKTYIALVSPCRDIPQEGRIDLPLSPDYDERPRQKVDRTAGKPAVTEYSVLSRTDGHFRLELHPLTGRTHQLRVHCAHKDGLGCPILGDRLYGSPFAPRLFLHAARIVFAHPVTGLAVSLGSDVPF